MTGIALIFSLLPAFRRSKCISKLHMNGLQEKHECLQLPFGKDKSLHSPVENLGESETTSGWQTKKQTRTLEKEQLPGEI